MPRSTSTFTTVVDLPDGRHAVVRLYDDGGVQFKLTDGPYLISQAFLPGKGAEAIIKLVRP